MPLAFNFLGLYCFADTREAHRYYFLPSAPDVRRDADNRPMFTTIDVGSSGHVMFTATWQAASASVEALRHEIASGHHVSEGAITLSFAPVSSPACHVLLGDGAGSFQTIATSATSGIPPYDALFSLSAPSERVQRMKRALQGDAGFLGIEYVANLLVPTTAAATFRATRPAELLQWLRSRRDSDAPVRDLLEEAVHKGLATATVTAPDVGSEIALEAFDRVLKEAAELVPRWIREGRPADFEVVSTIERDVKEPIRVFADIGDIVAGRAGRR